MDGTLDQRYDFALLGTSLPISTLSAALSRAGYSVLHVDDAEHYGGPWASLTLEELVQRASVRGEGGIVDMQVAFRDEGGSSIPDTLKKVNRHFAISLAPTLLPCAGPTIEVLVRSRVANYCTFRLLQRTAVYSNESRSKDDWPLRSVPSSKEDIFKDKTLSLIDKRKLMKLLQQAVPGRSEDDRLPPWQSIRSKTFHDYLTSSDGPALSQRLASDVAYGVALCASADESAANAMHRVQRHIASVGRYGNSAYLIGQYGGAGEMAQCYCRASAVQGGTFVLSHAVRSLQKVHNDDLSRWQIALEGIDGHSRVGSVIGDADMLSRVRGAEGGHRQHWRQPIGRQAMAVMLLDRGMSLTSATPTSPDVAEDEDHPARAPVPETALVIFPPPDHGSEASQKGAIWALQMGEGTFSCPKGTYLVYLYASLPQSAENLQDVADAKALLRHARQGVLQLASQSAQEWGVDEGQSRSSADVRPLFECYMIREAPLSADDAASSSMTTLEQQREGLHRDGLLSVPSTLSNVATALDDATVQAEDLYWLLCGRSQSQSRDTASNIRRDAEALRRRQQRAAAGQNPIGRGLAGTVEQIGAAAEEDHTVCDFFPTSDQTADD